MRLHKKVKCPFLAILLSVTLLITVSFSNKAPSSTEELCRENILDHVTTISRDLEMSLQTLSQIKNTKKKRKKLIEHYHSARRSYKQIEFFIEYYSAFDAKYYINGPLVPKYEIEFGPQIFEPMGFQVIEEILFSNSEINFSNLEKQYQHLLQKFIRIKDYYTNITIEQNKITEALRIEIIRVMCLNLNGYDCTINKEALTECAHALNGISTITSLFASNTSLKLSNEYINLSNSLKSCTNYLQKNNDSDKFNRLLFITDFLNPLYNNLCLFISKLGFEPSQVNYGINFQNHSVFDIHSINKQHFSLYRDDLRQLNEQAELGKLLFFDPILSGNNKRACASCHKPDLAFTDGLDKSLAFDGRSKITRNSPTLINASYQKLYFYDGRVFNLEEQAGEVFHNTFEMNSSADEIVSKLRSSKEYVTLFKAAFKNQLDSSITFYAVMKSIAEYIKTLESKNSKFDKYIRGDKKQLNKSEINGFNLFNGKALCGSCHFYPLFNGLVPPMFNDNEFEVLGTPENETNKNMDSDIGREKITKAYIHNRAFKTPTIRNIELTAPYMHNGAYKTLDQVLEFYNKGGGVGLKFKIENQTLPFDSLNLSKEELNDIKSFLLCLTDTSKTKTTPKYLPKFNDSELNNRKIGGEY
jgi:cytochrome c peroxidase